MDILETLKKWADAELSYLNMDNSTFDETENYIIRWYFFGSCDVCSQIMELDDQAFLSLYRQTLTHIGIPNEAIEEAISVWMLDMIENDELSIINKGAHSFRDFKENPNGVGGLKFCFKQFSKKKIDKN